MNPQQHNGAIWLILGAVNGLFAVAVAAWGSHGAALDPATRADQLFELGYLFQLCHALVVVAIGFAYPRLATGQRLTGFAALGFVAGMALFSGSLYWLAFNGPGSLGALAFLTPVGGSCLLIGWIVLVIAGVRLNFAGR